MLQHLNLKQVPDKSFIEYIRKNTGENRQDIDQLIQEHEAQSIAKKFTPLQSALVQKIKSRLMSLFSDKEKIKGLSNAGHKELSKEIIELLQAAANEV